SHSIALMDPTYAFAQACASSSCAPRSSTPGSHHRVQAITETFINMKADLDRERLVYERHWNQREKQIHRVLLNTAGMYGDLQGLIGPSMLAIPALEAGAEESETPAAEL